MHYDNNSKCSKQTPTEDVYGTENKGDTALYRKLLPMTNKFVYLRQGSFSRSYIGRVMSVEPDCVELQTYYDDGTEAELWTISLQTLTEFAIDSKELNTLALKVKWATSRESQDAVEQGPNLPKAES